jgi:uncharacterized protein YjbI with pentapeptide repeats
MNVRHLASRVASRYLLSKDRYQRETGQSLPRWKEKLNEYEERGNLFLHFSTVPRLAIYPNNEYETPTGFYTYPLKYEKIKDPNDPTATVFAMGRPYGVILSLKPGANILRISRYGESDLQRDIAKLREKFSISDEEIEGWKSDAKVKSPAGMIWNITRKLSERIGGNSVHRWTSILWKTLGYDGVDDDLGKKVIHESEPYQAVFFNTKAVELEEIIQFHDGSGNSLSRGDRGLVNRSKKILSGRDLSGQDFSRQNLRGSNLSGSNLSGSNLSGANLMEATLHRTNLSGANLQNTDFTSAIMVGANLSGANLTRTILQANLTKANLVGAKFDLTDFRFADLKGANLERTTIKGTMYGADLSGANLYIALLGANLERANLTGANLTSAFFYPWSNLKEANLTGAKLIRVHLKKANLSGANLSGANLTDAKLTEADLRGANLTSANLTGADLTEAILVGANLTGADLTGANLTGADLTGAKLDGVKGYNP